jgi:ubiquinone/menaquinone biosynthesis C-methylase UbiE
MKTLRGRYEDVGSRWRQNFGSIRRPDLFGKFIDVIEPIPNAEFESAKVLGLMSGDAGFELYFANHLVGLNKRVELDILDFSPTMLETAESMENIALRKIIDDVRCTRIEDEYDFVILKFGLHDLTREDQLLVLRNIPRLMHENGRLILIAYFSPTSEAQIHHNSILEKKDELLGYKTQRHFATLGEIIDMLIRAGLNPRIEMLSESNINYFKTELLDSEIRKVFNAKLFQMNIFAGIDALLGIAHTADGPEITFPLAVLTAIK